MWTGPLSWLTRQRFTAGLAKVRVTVVWIRAGGHWQAGFHGHSIYRDRHKYTAYQEQIQRKAHRSHGKGLAMKSGEVQEGKSSTARSPFRPRRKESTAIAWSIAHQ